MEKNVKTQQYKTFGFIAVGLIIIFIVMMVFRESRNSKNLKFGRFYKKEIKTGVDALSDKELWVERSTNEIDSIRTNNKNLSQHNERLQKQLDSIQKLVIGLGVHLHAFDNNILEDTSISTSNSLGNLNDISSTSSNLSFDKLENLISQKGISPTKVSPSEVDNITSSKAPIFSEPNYALNSQILKNGIKVIKFNNSENEDDLDENFIFAGTYARAILIGSVTVSAGVGASSNPKPVLLRISDTGNLPNNIKGLCYRKKWQQNIHRHGCIKFDI